MPTYNVLHIFAETTLHYIPIKTRKRIVMNKDMHTYRKQGLLLNIFRFYYDGFKSMTLGKTLWVVILIKLAIIFFVLKLFFFPNYIDSKSKNKDKADFVSEEILNR